MPVAVSFFVTWILLWGYAQTRPDFSSPEQIVDVVDRGTNDERRQLRGVLNLPFDLRSGCDATAERATLEIGHDDAVVQIKCSYDFDLILLRHLQSGSWSLVDSLPLDAAYDMLTIQLRNILGPKEKQVVIHNHVVGRGTGLLQTNFMIMTVAAGKFRVVLDAVEEAHVSPDKQPDDFVKQKSTFEIEPEARDGLSSIVETQILSAHGTRMVLKREYDWDERLGEFQPSFWSSVKPISGTPKTP